MSMILLQGAVHRRKTKLQPRPLPHHMPRLAAAALQSTRDYPSMSCLDPHIVDPQKQWFPKVCLPRFNYFAYFWIDWTGVLHPTQSKRSFIIQPVMQNFYQAIPGALDTCTYLHRELSNDLQTLSCNLETFSGTIIGQVVPSILRRFRVQPVLFRHFCRALGFFGMAVNSTNSETLGLMNGES